MNLAKAQLKTNDEWMTPISAWENIKEYMPKNATIYEPFSGDGQNKRNLQTLGFSVLDNTEDDFFLSEDHKRCTHIISNPPFSKKKEIFKKLKEIDKPFILIIPTTSLQTKFTKNIFNGSIQIIMPSYRIQFKSPDETKNKSSCSFTSCYLTYKMNLPQDLIFI
jgi:hypothetical protein